MDYKYYIPADNELHIGFEYELLGSTILIENVYDIELALKNPIRVKYLDNILYLHLTKWLVVGVGEANGDKQTVFAGHVKNKSELKKLMTQLGI
jgi:hypothetical protein